MQLSKSLEQEHCLYIQFLRKPIDRKNTWQDLELGADNQQGHITLRGRSPKLEFFRDSVYVNRKGIQENWELLLQFI